VRRRVGEVGGRVEVVGVRRCSFDFGMDGLVVDLWGDDTTG
jgi:hypothetical protein